MSHLKKKLFDESAALNNQTYLQYYNRLQELALTMFEWQNVPDGIDVRYLELCLFEKGKAVFFKDEALGYLCLPMNGESKFNVYRIPTKRRAYGSNGYQMSLDETNSVIIYNNYLHTNSMPDVRMFARRLYDIDRSIDINAQAQKHPILISCPENQRLSMLQLYKEYTGNSPVIFGEKELSPNAIKVLNTGAPYVADRLYQLKQQYWCEALTYLGISNSPNQKKERLITSEVDREMGGTVASRYSRLVSRQNACKQINKMFGTNIRCVYRTDSIDGEGEIGDVDV